MSLPELKSAKEIEEELRDGTKDPLPEGVDPKSLPEYEFELNYTGDDGRRWQGKFKNRILKVGERFRKLPIIKAQLLGNLPLHSFDETTLAMTDVLAQLMMSLVERPKWAEDLEDIYDEQVLLELNKEVMAHEATFRKRRENHNGD